MATITIDLVSLLTKAIKLSRADLELDVEDIVRLVLSKVEIPSTVSTPAPSRAVPAKTSRSVKTKDTEDDAPKVSKPRAPPTDEVRCCARAFYEKDHLEGGVLRVMRDDPSNLYGDRCKFKKTGDTDFCKHHEFKQPLGVWDGEYSGKFKAYVEKTESESEKPKSAKSSKKTTKVPIEDEDTEIDEELVVSKSIEKSKPKVVKTKVEDLEMDEEDLPRPKTKKEEPKKKPTLDDDEEEEEDLPRPKTKEEPKKSTAEKSEEAEEVEECEIDGKKYYKDSEGTIYDENEEPVGEYDFERKKWTAKYN